jgi:hypothetical protein
MKTPWLYKANELKHWSSDVKAEFNGKEIFIPARPYTLSGLNIFQRVMNAWGVFTGKYDAVDWQEHLIKQER